MKSICKKIIAMIIIIIIAILITGGIDSSFDIESHSGRIIESGDSIIAVIDGNKYTDRLSFNKSFKLEAAGLPSVHESCTESIIISRDGDGTIHTSLKLVDSMNNVIEDTHSVFEDMNSFLDSYSRGAYFSETYIMTYDKYGHNTSKEYSNTDGEHYTHEYSWVGDSCVFMNTVYII